MSFRLSGARGEIFSDINLMKVIKVQPYNFGCNSYIVSGDGKNAVIIDCAEPEIYDVCIKNKLNPVAVLLTHGHFDHVGGCGKFYEKNIPIYCGEYEKDLIHSPENRGIFGGVHIPEFEIFKTLKDGEEVELAGVKFKVIHTPGHTAGGVCYIAEDCLFSGDTLFKGSVGRSDLPTGDWKTLIQSVKKLFALDGDYKVYCGHESETTLNYERKYNPYA